MSYNIDNNDFWNLFVGEDKYTTIMLFLLGSLINFVSKLRHSKKYSYGFITGLVMVIYSLAIVIAHM